MARQAFNSPGAAKPSLTSFAAINTTITESCLWNNTVTTALQIPYAQIPAYDMKPGSMYKVSFGGVFSTTATGPTIIFTPRIGPNATAANAANVSLGVSPTITLAANLTAVPFYGEFTTVIRAISLSGAGVTAAGAGWVTGGAVASTAANTSNGTSFDAVFGGTIPTTVDDSVLSGLLVNVTWGTSNAGNTITCQWVKFEDN